MELPGAPREVAMERGGVDSRANAAERRERPSYWYVTNGSHDVSQASGSMRSMFDKTSIADRLEIESGMAAPGMLL